MPRRSHNVVRSHGRGQVNTKYDFCVARQLDCAGTHGVNTTGLEVVLRYFETHGEVDDGRFPEWDGFQQLAADYGVRLSRNPISPLFSLVSHPVGSARRNAKNATGMTKTAAYQSAAVTSNNHVPSP